ncbi:MAG: phosphatidate cytidylyltransferase [Deltaproteobacteria bacterium]|nr:phosphatidate cytidylyltransferase [Deltaproteobacteria bacterium]MBW2620499.1 phosphatidate cytidylyltransferase [Deltaproteobacteria bacterium]
MHSKRWITAFVTIPFLALLTGGGGALMFAVVIGAVCLIALWEFFHIVRVKTESLNSFCFKLLAFIMGPAIIWAAYMNSLKSVLGLIALNLIVSALISLPKFKSDTSVSGIVFKQVLGVIYIPFFLSFLVLIRNGDDGVSWIFFLLIVVFLGDTGAFYTGSYLGKHKLCPAVSPHKTIEGSVGGLAVNVCAGALFKFFFFPLFPWGLSIIFFLSIGVAGQVGDLFESELKRVSNIKDSGALLPGHGGFLDRIDALLFAAPIAYCFKEYIL